jgi:hypothetical protein
MYIHMWIHTYIYIPVLKLSLSNLSLGGTPTQFLIYFPRNELFPEGDPKWGPNDGDVYLKRF